MKTAILYGKGELKFNVPENTSIIEPNFIQGLKNPKDFITNALRKPINSKPLKSKLKKNKTLAISVCDITRAQPRKIILESIIEEIKEIIHPSDITIIIATGTHRENSKEEIITMLGPEIPKICKVVNHNSRDLTSLLYLGKMGNNVPVYLNKLWLEADYRITTGFVEPHFFAGFSGGAKMVSPGLAGIETVLVLHNPERIKHPNSKWGIIDGNPIQQDIRQICKETGVDFSLDVTLNKFQEITNVFAGELIEMHKEACSFSRKNSMIQVDSPFDVVITGNSGYPLDQNLYQTIKGISSAYQITKKGGKIYCGSECIDGLPNHGSYSKLLKSRKTPHELIKMIEEPSFHSPDQWQVQIQSQILQDCKVFLQSEGLTNSEIVDAHLNPIKSIENEIKKIPSSHSICVLPEGPQTIPYLK
ncbi:MAG: hypothetical protein CL764_05765 [Chloroflexi bacterium]|nr:hypothetical protein [Chloroflexota bacterium]|tara:strand:- start:3929 stop:5182 length:1254 start_codon:yes stop_codon:yes gene_type:complete